MASTEDEETDLASLQAQIDVSMAATTALVSDWVNPALRTVSSRRLSEKEFEESLRRPARLGVGAPLPQSSVAARTHDAARLKGRLTGGNKKRRLDSEEGAPPDTKLAEDDDEEEGRGRAIKKKVKVDPFSAAPKPNKSKENKATNVQLPTTRSTAADEVGMNESPTTPGGNSLSTIPAASSSNVESKTPPTVEATTTTSENSRHLSPPVQLASKYLEAAGVARDSQSSISGETSNRFSPLRQLGEQPNSSEMNIDLQLPSGSKSSVLNLDGPPPEAAGHDASTHKKKKRKRRRRKKSTTADKTDLEQSSGEDEE